MSSLVREVQVNTHPNDIRHFPSILAHVQRAWGRQVDRGIDIVEAGNICAFAGAKTARWRRMLRQASRVVSRHF